MLVNNASVERNGSIEELPLADFRAVMETNYFVPLRCIHAVVQIAQIVHPCPPLRTANGNHAGKWGFDRFRFGGQDSMLCFDRRCQLLAGTAMVVSANGLETQIPSD